MKSSKPFLVDSHIRIPFAAYDWSEERALRAILTFDNPIKDRAAREKLWGWKSIPDEICLLEESWEHDFRHWVVPRGIAHQFGPDQEWVDARAESKIDTSDWKIPKLRPYQEKAATAIEVHEQGVYEAPAGSGKTLTALEVIRRVGQRSLIIVDRANIAQQWKDRAMEFFGVELGIIGDGVYDEKDVTVALQQTLWSQKESLQNWWGWWGLVVLDECHHCPAPTFYEIFQKFPAKYRFGVSATPDKQKGWEKLVEAAVGPTIHRTEADELVKAGHLLKPSVSCIDTRYKFTFWPTHTVPKGQTCTVYGCTRKGFKHRNNYQELINDLIHNDSRNIIISDGICDLYYGGRTILVLSRRLDHLHTLDGMVGSRIGDQNTYRLSGQENIKERMKVYEAAAEGNIVIFSTIGDEALDIPRLDTLVLAYPSKSEGLIEQQAGRIARVHPNKKKPLIIDFCDDVKVLRNQLDERLRTYGKLGIKIG